MRASTARDKALRLMGMFDTCMLISIEKAGLSRLRVLVNDPVYRLLDMENYSMYTRQVFPVFVQL